MGKEENAQTETQEKKYEKVTNDLEYFSHNS